jgi:L-threonylcarbamoyladenylate synthase
VIPSLITAETGFVGLRMPSNEIALELLKVSGLPIAAPSANKFGHVSPSKA